MVEIEAALPSLTAEELFRIERAVDREILKWSYGILYRDAYGVALERDLITSADEAFQAYDKAEADDANGQTR